MASNILVVDDEESIRQALLGVLGDEGFNVFLAKDGYDALQMVKEKLPDVVLLDIWMQGIDGIEVLKSLKKQYPTLAVIMISGHGTIETAVKATKLGAYDFIEKPLHLDKIIITINHAIKERRLREENISLKRNMKKRYDLIGESKHIVTTKEQMNRIAPTSSWVLITGENGTGKELVARNIHLLSKRRKRPFVEVNCAAIPEELIESELFGYEKGSFTGAINMKTGRFDAANGGTIFLDEIGDMSLKTQAKILRVLQEQSFTRVGGGENLDIDVRVIAATNKDLQQEIASGRFREDLYFRLNVIPFHVVPLRERKSDIPLFVRHFLSELTLDMGKHTKGLTDKALQLLQDYHWPGNVRELKNLIERLVIMSPGENITDSDLPDYIRARDNRSDDNLSNLASLRKARDNFERDFILRKLEENRWNISKTANKIGVERTSLYRKIKSYDISVESR